MTTLWIQIFQTEYKCREYIIIWIQNDFKDMVPDNAPFGNVNLLRIKEHMSISKLGISPLLILKAESLKSNKSLLVL